MCCAVKLPVCLGLLCMCVFVHKKMQNFTQWDLFAKNIKYVHALDATFFNEQYF